jgi:hypothetical protein
MNYKRTVHEVAIEDSERSIRIRNGIKSKQVLATTHANGWKMGRPPLSGDIKTQIHQLRNRGLSIRGIERRLHRKVSKTTIGRLVKCCK